MHVMVTLKKKIIEMEKEKKKNNQLFGLMGKVFAKGLGDQGSVPGRVIPKT